MQSSTQKKKFSASKGSSFRTLAMVAVLVLLWIGFTFLTSDGFKNIGTSFISARNLSNLLRQMAIVGIMASSMVLVIVTGGIDLSAGSVMGFISCLAAALQVYYNFSTPATIIMCILCGCLIYLVQGSIIAYAGVIPFIVTLGGQLIFKGLILAITKGATIAPLKDSLKYFGQAYIPNVAGWILGAILSVMLLFGELQKRKSKSKYQTLNKKMSTMIIRWIIYTAGIFIALIVMNSYRGMPVPVLIMLIFVIILTLISERTIFGRKVYAIGGNLDAAKYSGINVPKTLVFVYVIHGVLISIAGIILAARLDAGTTSAGRELELDAIAAAVIGGTSMTGGVGRVAGAILGALIMASIDNGMSMMNLDAYWQYIVKGAILVAAVYFDLKTSKKGKA